MTSQLNVESSQDEETLTFVSLLKEQGFKEYEDFEVIRTESNESPEWASRDVVKAIRDSQKPVFIWSSQKGSADALEALLQYPKIRGKVKSWISVRGVLNGTPLADNAKRPELMATTQMAQMMPLAQAFRLLIDFIMSFKEKYSEALYSFNREVRAKYFEKNKTEILKISQEINTLFVSSQEQKEWAILKNHPYLLLTEKDSKKLSSKRAIQRLLSHFRSFYSYQFE